MNTTNHVRTRKELENLPEYAKLNIRRKFITDDLNDLDLENNIDTAPGKLQIVQGRIRALQSELARIAERMNELATQQVELFATNTEITSSDGYKTLLAAVEKDEAGKSCHDCRGKLSWVIERAKHYAEVTGLDASQILNVWERERNYWYMNYYQDCNQPLLTSSKVRVFESQRELVNSIGKSKFRCPMCGGVSKNPYSCDTGLEMSKGKICDWKVGGLFRDLGKGVFIFLKDKMQGETIFMPIAWETK